MAAAAAVPPPPAAGFIMSQKPLRRRSRQLSSEVIKAQGERSQQQNNKQTAQQRHPGASRRTSSQSYTHMLIEFCNSPLWSPVRCVSPNESISDTVCRCMCTHLVGGRPCSCTRAGGSFGSTPCPLLVCKIWVLVQMKLLLAAYVVYV